MASNDASAEERAGGHGPSALARAAALRLGNFLFWSRNYVFPVVLVALAVGTRPELAGGTLRRDAWLDGLGLLVAGAGQALRALVIGLEYIRRGGKDGRIYAGSLVDGGVFAHVRNPLYVGNLLVLAGLALVHNGRWFYALGVPFFLVAYVSITLAEEQYLGTRFGDEYRAYCARVPRFVPNVRGLGATLRAARFDWRKVLVKEYGSTFAWVTTALALIAWEHVVHGRVGDLRGLGVVLAGIWLALVACWATIRVLKKTRRLVARTT